MIKNRKDGFLVHAMANSLQDEGSVGTQAKLGTATKAMKITFFNVQEKQECISWRPLDPVCAGGVFSLTAV